MAETSDLDEAEPTSSRAVKRHCVGGPSWARLLSSGNFTQTLLIPCLRRTDIDHLQLVSHGVRQFVLHWLDGVLRDTEVLRERQMSEAGCPGFNLAFVPLVVLAHNAPTDQPCLCYVCEFNTSRHCLKHGEQDEVIWWEVQAGHNTPRRFECFVQQRRDFIPRTTREAVYAELWCLALWGELVETTIDLDFCDQPWATRQYNWTHVYAANVSRILNRKANLKIETKWISHEESKESRKWDVVVKGSHQTSWMIRDKLSSGYHLHDRANECRREINKENIERAKATTTDITWDGIPIVLVKAYHSYLAAATQKERALTPVIYRNCDKDCRLEVQSSFERPARITAHASSTKGERSVVTQNSPLRRHFLHGFWKEKRPTKKYNPRRINSIERVNDFLDSAPKNMYDMSAGQLGLLEARRLDKLLVWFVPQHVLEPETQDDVCTMSLIGSGEEEAEDIEDIVSVVWFVYLARGQEQALVWVLNERFVLQTTKIGKNTAVRIYMKDTGAPLITLRRVGSAIRDSPPSAGNERVCQKCRTHRTTEDEKVCLLCQYGLIVGDVNYEECDDGLHNPNCYVVGIQNRVNPREWQRFDINAIQPVFSHGDEVSKAYGDALVQLWAEGGRGVDAETQWQRKQGIALLTKLVGKPDELEKGYRAPNDGLQNGASRCWANTLLQMLGLSVKLREKLKASASLKVVNLFKVLELLQNDGGSLSRVERSKQTNAAAEAFYLSMGGIFVNKRHNCLDEGYRTLLSVLSDECPDAYDLFVGVMECQSVCQACRASRMWEQVLTLPVLAAPINQERELDFEETLKNNIVSSSDTAQNMCGGCGERTEFTVTYVVKVLPVVALVGIHRKYHIKRGATLIAKKSTSRVVNAKVAFTLDDQYGEVAVVPRAWGVHYGPSATEGHYVAYAAKGHSMATCFNDSKVSQVSLADVNETLISHVLLEFTRATRELTKTSRKRTRETANLMRAEANRKKLKAAEPSSHEDVDKSQVGGGCWQYGR